MNDYKEFMKMLSIMGILVGYFINLVLMFTGKHMELLVANVGTWLFILVVPLIIIYVSWLNK